MMETVLTIAIVAIALTMFSLPLDSNDKNRK